MLTSALKVNNCLRLLLFIFQFGYIEENHQKGSARGSEDHANSVMEKAQFWFSQLRRKNRFRPKVLAKVSHGGKCLVGASIAVNDFLRPLCLCKRISKFKWNFKKAIVHSRPLYTTDEREWKSSAFAKKEYTEEKAPCQKCVQMFKNLPGFITKENAGPARDSRSLNFVGNCAEYCPVNELLTDDMGTSHEEKLRIDTTLKQFWDQCTTLFSNYQSICDECVNAYQATYKKTERLEEAYRLVKQEVDILGLKKDSL